MVDIQVGRQMNAGKSVPKNTVVSRARDFLVRWLKRDGLAILMFALATLAMTYPLFLRLGSNWIPTVGGRDIFMKLWDIWWLDRVLTANQNPYFTTDLFFPTGIDLTLHSISWTASLLAWLLIPLVGSAISAYKLTILFGLFAAAYGAYLLIYELTKNRAAAWLGGAIYSFAPYHIAHSDSHPDMTHVAVIPIAALLLIKAIRNKSLPLAIGAALTIGVAAFTSLYILDFAAMTLAFLFIYLALEEHRWRQPQFWKIAAVFAAIVLVATLLRLAPAFNNTNDLFQFIDSNDVESRNQADLMAFIVPPIENPLFTTAVSEVANRFSKSRGLPPYLGLVALGLTLSAITWRDKRLEVWPWFGIGFFFFLLSLGSVLRFNGNTYEDIPLLYRYLSWFPPIKTVRPHFFHIGLLLPLAVCSAFGLLRWLEKFPQRRGIQTMIVLGLSLLLLAEYWNGPFPISETRVDPLYSQIAREDNSLAIIELPMGRVASKRYDYDQTIHGHSIVEGAIARTPPKAYRYIEQNALLNLWRTATELDCQSISQLEIREALDQLAEDGFGYVIVHAAPPGEPFASYLTAEPTYTSRNKTVYRLADLQATPPCPEN